MRRWKREVRRGRPAEAKPAEEKPRPAAADIIEAMGDGLIVTDLDGNIISVNKFMEEYLAKAGIDVKKFIGKSVLDLPTTGPEYVEKIAGAMKEVLEKGRAGPLEVHFSTGDWLSFTSSLLKDAESNPSAFFAVVRDITELKRLQEKEKEAAALNMASETIDAMPDALYVLDLEGVILSTNPAQTKIFGYNPEEIIGKSFDELVGILRAEDVEKFVKLLGELIEKGHVEPVETVIRAKDGREIPSSITYSLIKDAGGNPKNIIAVLRDVTERKHAEEELKAKEGELERAYKELAVLGRARAFAFILFKDAFEPLLKECGSRTIGKIRDQVKELGKRLPLAKGVRVGYDGSVTLDEASIREVLAGMTHEEATSAVTSTFSEIMDACDPIIRADIGNERATATASRVFSSLFERPEVSTYKSDLVRVVPDGVEIPRGYILLEVGRSYLVEERKPTHATRIFSEMASYGFPGLCISTAHPADVKREYGLRGNVTVLWLSKVKKDYSISPSSLGMLRDRITSFAERNENSVVLLDGLEYLISTNGFDLALKFLHDLMESVTLNRSRLIVPVSPATLEARELALLERSMEPIEVVEEE